MLIKAVTGKHKRINVIPLYAKKKDCKWNTKYVITNIMEKAAHETSAFDKS